MMATDIRTIINYYGYNSGIATNPTPTPGNEDNRGCVSAIIKTIPLAKKIKRIKKKYYCLSNNIIYLLLQHSDEVSNVSTTL